MISVRDIPIRRKLILVVFLTSTVALLLAAAGAFIHDFVRFRETTVSEVTTLATIIGENCNTALAFGNPKDAEQVLTSLKANPDILTAGIYASDNTLFAQYHRGHDKSGALPAMSPPIGEKFVGAQLHVCRPILLGADVVGSVNLQAGLGQFQQRVRWGAAILGLAMVGSLLVALLLSAVLQRIISEPIQTLARVAERVTQHKDYSLRAPAKGRDEIGLLMAAFNQMLAQIQKHDSVLRESEQRMQSILDNSSAVIYLKDPFGRYLLINRSFETLFHVTRDGVVGQTDYDIFPDATADAFRLNDSIVLNNGAPMQFEETAPHDDGQRTYLSVKFPLITADQEVYAICGISTDITERKRMEEQLIQAEKMDSVGRLAAGVAHEVKNPLMTIQLGIDYLRRIKLTSDANAGPVLVDIQEAVKRASDAISELLDFSAMRALQPAPEDLNALLEHSLGLVKHELLQSHITLYRDFGPSLPPMMIDRRRIEQVLVNLFMNAIHAMERGGTLTVRTALRNADDGAKPLAAIIEIDDTGSGIAAVNLDKLFKPFFTTKPAGKGTGLGLTVVRQIIELHEGTVDLRNRAEGGVRVTITLPTNGRKANAQETHPDH